MRFNCVVYVLAHFLREKNSEKKFIIFVQYITTFSSPTFDVRRQSLNVENSVFTLMSHLQFYIFFFFFPHLIALAHSYCLRRLSQSLALDFRKFAYTLLVIQNGAIDSPPPPKNTQSIEKMSISRAK